MPGPRPAGVSDGQVFRAVDRGDQVRGTALSEKVVWQLLQGYAAVAGVEGVEAAFPEGRRNPPKPSISTPAETDICLVGVLPTAEPIVATDDVLA